jgi:hypothetical protein
MHGTEQAIAGAMRLSIEPATAELELGGAPSAATGRKRIFEPHLLLCWVGEQCMG